MEYFFAIANDPDTHDIYVGGTSRSEYLMWGDVKRKNVMYNGQPGENNPDTKSAVGSSKAISVKLKSTLTPPSCLTKCDDVYPLQASDVKSGYCYIDRHCYADGTYAPYSGSECNKCDAAVNALEWSLPDTSAACFIDGACVAKGAHAQVQKGRSYVDDPCLYCDPSMSTSAYSPKMGCELPTDGTFSAGCYTDSGSMMMSMAAVMEMNNTMHATISDLQATISNLQTKLDSRCLNKELESDETVSGCRILSSLGFLKFAALIVYVLS
jgi:hypothetical protein